MCIYLYIYTERERERCIYIHTYSADLDGLVLREVDREGALLAEELLLAQVACKRDLFLCRGFPLIINFPLSGISPYKGFPSIRDFLG